jgi:branched-chain amino acid transport system substrate-binding protein
MRKSLPFAGMSLAVVALLLAGCGPTVDPDVVAQGVTDTTIKIGNAATKTGALAAVGLTFNAGLQAALDDFNEDPVGGRSVELVSYDDEFTSHRGQQLTERLVEDDKVFALVGHFGTPTVGATIPYIRDKGIPMVYAATGINQLYFQESVGNPILAVQPIYRTEGRIMVARAFSDTDLFGQVEKLGVLYTADDAGFSMLLGIENQAAAMGKTSSLVTQQVLAGGDYSAAILALKNAGVNVLIVAAIQNVFLGVLNAMGAGELSVPVLTSYVNASAGFVNPAMVTNTRPVYANAWVDIFSAEGLDDFNDFLAVMNSSTLDAGTLALALNPALVSFTIAGYIAARVFLEGIIRVAQSNKVLSWANYIAALEEAPVTFPMGGPIDFTGGKRWGVDALALLKFDSTLATPNYVASKPIQSLNQILGA